MQNSPIYEITPFTMTDYSDRTAAIAWFAGCNMRCAYCYNTQIVCGRGRVELNEFYAFLRGRVGKLDGVVFSGGECTCARNFIEILRQTKSLGFDIKIDTNGSNPDVIQSAINAGLADYVALDFKASKEKFHAITGSKFYDGFLRTLWFLVKRNFSFEVRTSVHADLLSEDEISQMAQTLYDEGYRGTYYLQKFLPTGENFGNLSVPKANFNPKKINSPLLIELRNF